MHVVAKEVLANVCDIELLSYKQSSAVGPSKTIFSRLSLPPEGQQEVADFIAFLRTRYIRPRARPRARTMKLIDETFIGIWRDRTDMVDSSAWVRAVREREWQNR